MQNVRGLPSRATLYATYLLAQSYILGRSSSFDKWVEGASVLPTGLTAPSNIAETAQLLGRIKLATIDQDSISLDRRILEIAQGEPSREVLLRLMVLLAGDRLPVWIHTVVGLRGDVDLDLVPHEDRKQLQSLGLDDDNVEAIKALFLALKGATTTRDTRSHIGNEGELVVLEREKQRLTLCGRPDLANRVFRVSSISDSYGYDIFTLTRVGDERWLEVKASASMIRYDFTAFLTRHEFSVAESAPDRWRLVAVSLHNGIPRILGCVNLAVVEQLVPKDSTGGQWTEAMIVIPVQEFRNLE